MNNYDLIEVIGEGTYGIVYKCRDRRTNRIVAVKQFKNFQINPYIRCTMLRELRVEQLLKGEPNVTQLLETFKQKNRLYLVMEYIPRSLLDVLEEHTSGLSEESLNVLLYTLLLGIRSCHRNGIIHRDIKPENILVRDDGAASLCDFGFCRPVLQPAASSPSASNSVQGDGGDPRKASCSSGLTSSSSPTTRASTLAYPPASAATVASAFLNELVLADHRGVMTDYVATRWYRSPEMLLGMPSYSYAVDMWAVGVIMAEAIDGEPLLPGKTELEQLALIQSRVGEFPAAYEAAVRKRHGGMLHLRSANALAKSQATARVKLSRGDGEQSSDANEDGCTISSYLSMRYGGRIKKTGMHLLAQLLCVDADGRPTVEEALAHPYFDSLQHDVRFAPHDASETEQNTEISSDEDDGVERGATTPTLTRPTTSSTADVTASAEPLPPLSPPMMPPVSTAGNRGSFARTAVETNSNGNSRVAQHAELGKNTGRPPRAVDVEAHASNAASRIVTEFSMDVSLPTANSGSMWQSATGSPRLATLLQLPGPPLPSLDGKDASTVAVSVADELKAGREDDARESNADDNSPQPRPVVQQSIPEMNLPQQRHAASEGASGSAATKVTNAFAQGGSSHVSTLLFKARKGRAVAESMLTRRRSTQSEESADGSGTSGASFSARCTHSPTAATAALGSSTLAPLLRRRSGEDRTPTLSNDAEVERAKPGSRRGSTSLHFSPTASKLHLASAANKSKMHAVAQTDNTGFVKIGVGPGREAEETFLWRSALNNGGDRQTVAKESLHKRTDNSTTRRAQQNKQDQASRKANRDPRKPPRPGLLPQHTPSTSRDESVTNRTAHASRADQHHTASEATKLAVAAATGRPSTKQQDTSQSRRRAQHRSLAAAAAALVSARNPSDKQTQHKHPAHRQVLVDGSTGTNATPKGRKKPPFAAADKSRFASPKLPRVVKPLQPRERMTLLKEIESLDGPVEAPSAVEVMVPARSSTSAKADDQASAEDEAETGEEEQDSVSHKVDSSTSTSALDAMGLPRDAGVSQLTVDDDDSDDELVVEDLDSGNVSRSPLLSDASSLGDSPAMPPPVLAAFPVSDEAFSAVTAAVDSRPSAPTAAAAQSLPPRADFDFPTAAATAKGGTNSLSHRAPPSLYFRSTRNASTPLKLAALHMTQGSSSSQPSVGGFEGAGTLTEGTSSSFSQQGSVPGTVAAAAAAAASAPSHFSCASFSFSSGRRPTPTLLRHVPPNVSISQPSTPSFPMDPPSGVHGGGGSGGGKGKSALQPLSISTAPNSGTSRTPHGDSPRLPVASSSLPVHKISAGYLSERPSEVQPVENNSTPADVRAANVPHQRRLSTTSMSLSVSGDLTHAGFLPLSRCSQERTSQQLPRMTAVAVSTPPTPTTNVEEVETEVLVETPRASPQNLPQETQRQADSPHVPTSSSRGSGTTAAMSGCTASEVSTITPQRSVSDDTTASSAPRWGSRTRGAVSAAKLLGTRDAGANTTPLTSGQRNPKRAGDEVGDELQERTQTTPFLLPFSSDSGEPPSETQLPALHPPQPVLGGVSVNVDSSKTGPSLHTASSSKKNRLIL
ncbi:mitogen-activated protein kinase putative (MPK8) [Leptomonas pyrrhocoris]|uniref:cyclin-dependent kinase n=1 Tax=Leptomonas pyrrhocoris TaxID=157538 RepID=A0A0N0DZN6_LEPPY|nr:mitogen-activated protein kinase putative (MPK8) [Leptomonas pyrrhocoris]KPA85492.1 mitogen-activated protein kinase putative (MPK8) [Leptomonas pyrrhocoris]|eukprot:XP_015663931.1 mitogen-activated protein kinase putative (MPK8) [Leptomonas pyrrhocoris]